MSVFFSPVADVGALSAASLGSVLDRSVDCVKLIDHGGRISYMNANGLCAMEIDDFDAVAGRSWRSLWPEEARGAIDDALARAAAGDTARFRAFCPTAKGDPRWWDVSVSPVASDDGSVAGYLSVSRDVTEQQSSREALEIAAAEMKHRLKNTYAIIASLMNGFARGNAEHEAFAEAMGERLAALSTAQSLFIADEASCRLDTLLPALVAPFDTAGCAVSVCDDCAITVDQATADAIALVVGELCVNAAKHGAIANGGSIAVTAERGADGPVVRWRERSAAAPARHARDGGQGLTLIDRIVRARRGTLGIAWQDDGLNVTLAFPAA